MSTEQLEWWCVNAASWMQHVCNQAELGCTINAASCDLEEGQRLLTQLDSLVEQITANDAEAEQ